ncbi:MAG TPA: alkaline phosphatase family protein, partial [Candidatus Acidoferrum sp.]|nr:alkaline phosphatase family protein [Candidatus Acidoferrum sp.]
MRRATRSGMACLLAVLLTAAIVCGQTPRKAVAKPEARPSRPKLIVMIVVDQMRGDYVDKFRGQWSGGLKRLLTEGAWFRAAAYPYAATETCPGHST